VESGGAKFRCVEFTLLNPTRKQRSGGKPWRKENPAQENPGGAGVFAERYFDKTDYQPFI
jgi:hypothetical protein